MEFTASYRGRPGNWEGVIKHGKTVVWACGHTHQNRDHNSTYKIAAISCACEVLDKMTDGEKKLQILRDWANSPSVLHRDNPAYALQRAQWALTEAQKILKGLHI